MNLFSKLEPLSPFPFSTITIKGHFIGVVLFVSLSPAILFNDSLVFFVVSISRQKDAKDIFEMQTRVLIHALKANCPPAHPQLLYSSNLVLFHENSWHMHLEILQDIGEFFLTQHGFGISTEGFGVK